MNIRKLKSILHCLILLCVIVSVSVKLLTTYQVISLVILICIMIDISDLRNDRR